MHHENNDERTTESSADTTRNREGLACDEPRVYVASLSDYNAGILHGRWLDAAVDPEDLWEGINEMLAASPTAKRYGVAEEWAIHDYDGFSEHVRLGESEAIERVAALARGVVAHGDAFAAWWAMVRDDEDEADDTALEAAFEEHYLGEWSSIEDYGEEMLSDMCVEVDSLPGIPDGLRPYARVDVEAWTRDMQLGGEIQTVESKAGVHVFWNV